MGRGGVPAEIKFGANQQAARIIQSVCHLIPNTRAFLRLNPAKPIMKIHPTRRNFLKSAGASAGALCLQPSGLFAAATKKPGDKLNIGFIGTGNQCFGHLGRTLHLGHNVAAFCDVDANQITKARHHAGDGAAKATDYNNYLDMLRKEQDLDAVVICTPDHWHAKISMAAIEAGKHVFCEKPLTHTLGESRQLRSLAQNSKVITQTGNQGSASGNFRRSIELIQAGLFGNITEIHVWHPQHDWPSGIDRPEGSDPVPEGLDWKAWLGPAPERPYKAGIYHPINWRGWYDFGGGSLADFCCHAFNLPVRALELLYPERIEISGTELGKESFAKSCTVSYHFPARGSRPPVKMHFYSGGDLPPEEATAGHRATFGSLQRTGCILVGEKGQLQSGLWNSDCYVMLDGDERFLGEGNHPVAREIPISLPRVQGHLDEWFDACLGGPKVFSDFDFGGHLTEIGLAGIVALRVGKSIDWDGEAMKVPGMPEADRFIRRT